MQLTRNQSPWEWLNICIFVLHFVLFFVFKLNTLSWILFGFGALLLLCCERSFRRNVALLYLSAAVLRLFPISTDLSTTHILEMSVMSVLAVALPYLISKFVYKEYLIRFPFHHGRSWHKIEIGYLIATVVFAYVLLPIYFASTNAHFNWKFLATNDNFARLLMGMMALGVWDDFFFVSTIMAILKKYIPFGWANALQSILFASFLFHLGFTGWGYIMIFIFALSQGYIFEKSHSLLYVLSGHLIMDLILFFAMVNAHFPLIFSIFLT